MNEVVGIKNRLKMGGGWKRVIRPFRRQELWKCIGCVLSAVTYGKKRQNIWSEIPKYFCNKAPTTLQRGVCRNNNVYKVCCDLYCPFYIYNFH